MKRERYAKLLEWQSRRDHKPLVLDGARQVGKTYILKEFGAKEYKSVSYVNTATGEKSGDVLVQGAFASE